MIILCKKKVIFLFLFCVVLLGHIASQISKKFKENILHHSPIIFHKWFERSFISPSEWFEARLEFMKSCACWSMVGFAVGLGDRHLENILINVKTGECVHVDFDCLFDKAKSFKVPEVVPFRLTRNIIDGFGVAGIEGSHLFFFFTFFFFLKPSCLLYLCFFFVLKKMQLYKKETK